MLRVWVFSLLVLVAISGCKNSGYPEDADTSSRYSSMYGARDHAQLHKLIEERCK